MRGISKKWLRVKNGKKNGYQLIVINLLNCSNRMILFYQVTNSFKSSNMSGTSRSFNSSHNYWLGWHRWLYFQATRSDAIIISGTAKEKELKLRILLIFFLCNDFYHYVLVAYYLIISMFIDEFRLWEAVQKWLMAPSHPERRGNTASPLLVSILPLIRFKSLTFIKNFIIYLIYFLNKRNDIF